MSCGVGCRRGSDLVLLWLWCRLTATAPIRPLAWESPYATGVNLKRQKNMYVCVCVCVCVCVKQWSFPVAYQVKDPVLAAAAQAAAVAQVRSLAQELPHVVGKVKKRGKNEHCYTQDPFS